MIGQTLSHYHVLEKLGEGGMGVVYLAEDTRLGRTVALKALSPKIANDPRSRRRFEQEARAAARLSHPGIAAVYELLEIGADLYIIYEYVRGHTLRAALSDGPLPTDKFLKVACAIADALASAHSEGIVHRDLKPENIILTPEGGTKILDFGLARLNPITSDLSSTSTRLTDRGVLVGTVSYMSPEQLENKEVDYRSDIFSFGILLYELATGMHPFGGSSSASTIARILASDPDPLLCRIPRASPELDRIIGKCLRKRREERYQSTRDLAVDLEQLARRLGEPPQSRVLEEGQIEPSLLRRAYSLVSPTPFRWWELNHLGSVFLVYPLFIYLAWRIKQWTPVLQGLALFIGVTILAAVSMTLRMFLLVTAAFNPRDLPDEVQRWGRHLRGASSGVAAILLLMAAFIMTSHTDTAALVLFLAVAHALISLMVEPAIDRAAFPKIRSSGG